MKMRKVPVMFLLLAMTIGVLGGTAYASASSAAATSMPDGMYALLADYGLGAMTWMLTLLAAAGAWLMVRSGLSAAWRGLVIELGAHARDVVLEVWQTYVEALKAARSDGKLTAEEKATAKGLAIEKIRARLSWPKLVALGGGMLARAFHHEEWAKQLDELLGGAVETAVGEAKRQGKAAGLKTTGKDIPLSASTSAPLSVPR
jgi:MFS family permease